MTSIPQLPNLLAQTKLEPREYQQRIIIKTINSFLERKLRSVLIESPVGSGKTSMALMVAKAMYETTGAKIGWVTMRRHLLTQVQSENISKGINVPMQTISMFDKDPPKNLDLLIVDEAQHDVTSNMCRIHAVTAPKWICGLSATPYRIDKIKLCFDTVIKDAGIATLIKDGYLSPYEHFTIPSWEVNDVVRYFLREPERWGKSIIYFHKLHQCRLAAMALTRAGIKALAIDTGTDADKAIATFKEGKIQVLLNCLKLTEGTDIPDLKTVWCRPSCKSVTIQMAGRVLRKHPDHKHKQVVQCEDTPYPFPKTALSLVQHILVKDEWRTLEVNENIEAINKRVLCSLAKFDNELPDFIKRNSKTTANRRWGRNRQMRRNTE